jgi:hypothetical protein
MSSSSVNVEPFTGNSARAAAEVAQHPPEVKTPVLVTTMAEAKARLQETINAERKREEEEASAREKSRTARPTHHRKNVFNVLSSLWLAWALRCAISLRGRSPPAF